MLRSGANRAETRGKPGTRNKRGFSVVATLLMILVISTGLAVGFTMWAFPLSSDFFRIQATRSRGIWGERKNGELLVTAGLDNAGSSSVVVEHVLLNNQPFTGFAPKTSVLVETSRNRRTLVPGDPSTYVSISPHEKANLYITVPEHYVAAGQVIDVKIQTQKGTSYLDTVVVP